MIKILPIKYNIVISKIIVIHSTLTNISFCIKMYDFVCGFLYNKLYSLLYKKRYIKKWLDFVHFYTKSSHF